MILGALLLAACSSAAEISTEAPTVPPSKPTGTSAPESSAAPTEHDPSDCTDPFDGENVGFSTQYWPDTDFCNHSVEYSEIFSGGPPPDAIPAIDAPIFETIEEADTWLGDNWPVMFFEANGVARAYPLAIMIWHEIVNDEVGGQQVSLTFCPLCNSTIAFNRVLEDGRVLDFGTSGNLRNSDLVMYDRQTRSWWQQFTGEAIVGELTGTMLELLPSQIIAWSDFKENYSDSEVLSRNTGHVRSYGNNPYGGYDDVGSSPFFPVGEFSGELLPVDRVVALTLDTLDVAFPFTALRTVGVVNEEYEAQPIAVFWKPGTNTTFGNTDRDVGSTGVFSRELDGQLLTFENAEEGFRDLETGSLWTIAGMAIDGPLEGSQLERLLSGEHFWFAWSVFKPDTIIWQP